MDMLEYNSEQVVVLVMIYCEIIEKNGNIFDDIYLRLNDSVEKCGLILICDENRG